MRKTVSLFLALIILLSSLYSVVFASINKSKDNVVITEEFTYGDKAFAENTNVNLKMLYRENLVWDINHSFSDGKTETAFSLYKNRIKHEYESENQLSLYTELNYTTYGNTIEDRGFNRAYEELIEEAVPYESAEKVIQLSDYIDYYPVSVDAYFPEGAFSVYLSSLNDYSTLGKEKEIKVINALRDFFKIPVAEDHKATIYVTVDENKTLHQSGMSSYYRENELKMFGFYAESIINDRNCFIWFSNKTNLGDTVDTSEIPGGYGIYALPYSYSEAEKSISINTDGLRNVFPVDEKEEITSLQFSTDKKELYMISKNEGTSYFTVIDAETYLEKSKIILSESKDMYFYIGYIDKEFLVIKQYSEYSDEALSVYLPDGKDGFRKEFTATEFIYSEEYQTDGGDYVYYPGASVSTHKQTDVVWDGERLYVTNSCGGSNYPTDAARFSLSVYDKDGLQFCGLYRTSLSTGNDGYQGSSYHIYSSYYDKIKIKLN